MNPSSIYAVFGGFGDQCWSTPGSPNIRGKCDGLTVCEMDQETGEMHIISQSHGVESPSTLVVSPNKRFIYASNEGHDFQGIGYGGGVTAFSFDAETGETAVINDSLSFGSSACYVSIDKSGKYLLVANHGAMFYVTRFKEENGRLVPNVMRDEGCVSLFEIREDGGIGDLLDRLILEGTGGDPFTHGSAHPHSVLIDKDDFVIVPNKGGDNIYVAKLNRETRKLDLLSVFETEHASSPRHAYIVEDTPWVLVQNEYDAHLCSYSLDRENGKLCRISRVFSVDENPKEPDISTDTKKIPWGLDVQVHPNKRFVYTDNTRGQVTFSELNLDTGELTVKEYYSLRLKTMPRGMQITPDGQFLVVTGVMNDNAVVMRINQENGTLTRALEVELPTPTALRFIVT